MSTVLRGAAKPGDFDAVAEDMLGLAAKMGASSR
jgi:hypothetical protein